MTIHTHRSLDGRELIHDHDGDGTYAMHTYSDGHSATPGTTWQDIMQTINDRRSAGDRPLIPDAATEAAQIDAENTANAKIIEDPVEHRVYHRSKVDHAGRPAGGWSHGTGFSIAWQDGPTQGVGAGRNGAFVEEVIEAAIGRLEFYQASAFHCVENAVALGHLQTALGVLRERTAGRRDRGVEGTHQL